MWYCGPVSAHQGGDRLTFLLGEWRTGAGGEGGPRGIFLLTLSTTAARIIKQNTTSCIFFQKKRSDQINGKYVVGDPLTQLKIIK